MKHLMEAGITVLNLPSLPEITDSNGTLDIWHGTIFKHQTSTHVVITKRRDGFDTFVEKKMIQKARAKAMQKQVVRGSIKKLVAYATWREILEKRTRAKFLYGEPLHQDVLSFGDRSNSNLMPFQDLSPWLRSRFDAILSDLADLVLQRLVEVLKKPEPDGTTWSTGQDRPVRVPDGEAFVDPTVTDATDLTPVDSTPPADVAMPNSAPAGCMHTQKKEMVICTAESPLFCDFYCSARAASHFHFS